MRICKRFSLAALLALFVTVQIFADTPIWSYKGAKWYAMMETGNLIVAGDTSLAMIDGANGSVIWKRNDLKGIQETEYNEITGTPVVLIADNFGSVAKKTKIYALDQMTGKTVWETEKVYGYTVQVSPVKNRDMVVVLTTKSNAVTKDKPDITALKITTGEVLWQTEYPEKVDLYVKEKFRRSGSGAAFAKAMFGNPFAGFSDQPRFDLSGENPPIFDGEAMFMTYAGLHKYDLKTGNLVWKTVYDVTDGSLKRTNGQAIIDGDTVYTSAKNIIRAIDKNSGAIRWQTKDFGEGGIAEMQLHGDVVYGRMGGQFFSGKKREYQKKTPIGVVALNKTNGNVNWIYTGAKNSITNMVVLPEENVMLIGDEKNIIGLDLASSGKVKESYKIPLKFKFKLGAGAVAGKIAKIGFGGIGGAFSKGPDTTDEPIALMRQENGTIVARGRQHLLAFDPKTKQIVWSTKYGAPGVEGWQQIVMTAITIASAAVSQGFETSYANRGDYNNAFRENDNFINLMTNYQNFMETRFTNTKRVGNIVYVLTDVKSGKDKGAGLVGVNLMTGQGASQIMFKDKTPDYEVDEASGRLFNLNKGELVAFSIAEKAEMEQNKDDGDEEKSKDK